MVHTVIVAQLVRALVCGSRGRRFEPGLSPKTPQIEGFFALNGEQLAQHLTNQVYLNQLEMFTLFKSSPKFPVLKPVNIGMAKSYLKKFEESLKIFEEIQKESLHS